MVIQLFLASWRKLTIGVALVLVCGLLYAPPLQAAGMLPPTDPAYRQGVQLMYEQVQADPDRPDNQAFHDVLDQLFKPAAVQIPFRFVTERNGVRSLNYAGNIYFSQGALFVDYDQSDVDERFATIDNQLYTWQPGRPQGQILQRFPGDTLAFVMYMVDPSAIMRSIYAEYLAAPDHFRVERQTDGTESLLYKQLNHGFRGIRLQPQPFWLRAFMVQAPDAANSPIDQPEQVGELEIDPPIALEQLPESLMTLPQNVTFKPSDESLKNRMTYS